MDARALYHSAHNMREQKSETGRVYEVARMELEAKERSPVCIAHDLLVPQLKYCFHIIAKGRTISALLTSLLVLPY